MPMNFRAERAAAPDAQPRVQTASPSGNKPFSRGASRIGWWPRALYIATMLYGGALFWIAPRPPMTDLPQHAGQVMLLRDLLEHTSPWRDLVHINLFTPYLIGYVVTLPLTYVMPIFTAIKLVLTLAYLAFVVSCIGFRRHLNGDPRLDVLFVPAYFGFAFAWGFYTFLVAAPVGILFIWLAHSFARTPSLQNGVGLFLTGTTLFFCHGLVFLFACAIGVGFVQVQRRPYVQKVRALAPFLPLGLLCIAYGFRMQASDPLLARTIESVALFDSGWKDWKRLAAFPVFVWGATKEGVIYLPLIALMALAPWLWRDRINPDRAAMVPIVVVSAIWVLVPSTVIGIWALYQRFAMFLLPAYALMFVCPKSSGRGAPRDDPGSVRCRLAGGIQLAIVAGCWMFLTDQSIRLRHFAEENASFEQLLSETVPGQRALNLVFDKTGAPYRSIEAYKHQALWYQAEKHGFVDFNFAMFRPQVVQFKPGQFPLRAATLQDAPDTFAWKRDDGRAYRYFFVHKDGPLALNFFVNDECDVALIAHSGRWSLYERRNCR